MKNVESELNVFIQVKGKFLLAGKMALDGGASNFSASFKYDDNYLQLAQEGNAFAIDPINLPLSNTNYRTTSRYHILGAIFDAAPDAWGRFIIASNEEVAPSSLQERDVLIKGKGSGVGAIVFAPIWAEKPDINLKLPNFSDVDSIYKIITNLQAGVIINESDRELLISSWDIGGARPKAILLDSQGIEWIVKFPKSNDTYSRERVEWANLEMARVAGMNVPETDLIELPDGKAAMITKRFDRRNGIRSHFLSAVSFISPKPDFNKYQLDSPYGASIFSYSRIAHVIRTIGSNINKDLPELFGRMVLNILVGNTDDHLKNTGFLMDNNNFNNYYLAPLYDVVTQESDLPHMIHIGPKEGRKGTIENALSGAKLMGLKPNVANDIIKYMLDIVSIRKKYYVKASLNEKEIETISKYISAENKPIN